MTDPKPVRYLVTWTVDVWADNPYEAAMQAQHRQQLPTTASCFVVEEVGAIRGFGNPVEVDLNEEV